MPPFFVSTHHFIPDGIDTTFNFSDDDEVRILSDRYEIRRNGELHCLTSHALSYNEGTSCWYKQGKLHRTDGPAVSYSNGSEEWYYEGKLHRTGGPALIYKGNDKVLFRQGNIHRIKDVINDRTLQLPDEAYIGGKHSKTSWYHQGQLHRVDGPAVLYSDGNEEWYINGVLHRIGGPALYDPDGSEEWYVNGLLHREDGPAVSYPGGIKEWWVNGKKNIASVF